MNDVAWRHQQFRTKYLYLLLLVAVFALRPVYTGRMYGCQKCTGIYGPYIRMHFSTPVHTGRIYWPYIYGRSEHTTRIYGPYSRKALRTMLFLYGPYLRAVYTGDRYALPVHTARTYGPYVRVSKMHRYIRAVTVNTARIYGCSVHTTRIELLFCTGHIYGWPVCTTRKYGPCIRVSKMHPYIRAVNMAPYIRAVFTGSAYRP